MKAIILIFLIAIGEAGFSQSKDSTAIDNLLRALSSQQFTYSYSLKSVPKFVKRGIKKIEGRKFRAADKGKKFNATDVSLHPARPFRRIIYIARSGNLFVITYEQGGFRTPYKSKFVHCDKKKISSIVTLQVPYHETIDSLEVALARKENVVITGPFD